MNRNRCYKGASFFCQKDSSVKIVLFGLDLPDRLFYDFDALVLEFKEVYLLWKRTILSNLT